MYICRGQCIYQFEYQPPEIEIENEPRHNVPKHQLTYDKESDRILLNDGSLSKLSAGTC